MLVQEEILSVSSMISDKKGIVAGIAAAKRKREDTRLSFARLL